jgi:hypothetical protein
VLALMLAGCQADESTGGSLGEVPITLTTAVQANSLSATRAAADGITRGQFLASQAAEPSAPVR